MGYIGNLPLALLIGMAISSLIGGIGGAYLDSGILIGTNKGFGLVIGLIAPIAYAEIWVAVVGVIELVRWVRTRRQQTL